MNETLDENVAASMFVACGLRADAIPRKRHAKSPDFEVSGHDGKMFFCEIKSVRSSADKPVSNDSLYGAITNDVATATEQFAAVNSIRLVPNVLAWVTHNPRYNVHTFADLVRGKVIIEGEAHGDLGKQRFGKFDKQFRSIDLFIWIHHWGAPEALYNVQNRVHAITLARMLGDLVLLDRQSEFGDWARPIA